MINTVTSESKIQYSPLLLEAFSGIEDHLPHTLLELHPHIIVKLNSLWPGEECVSYLDELMLPQRAGRKGFHPLVIREILFLKNLHQLAFPARIPPERAKYETYKFSAQARTLHELAGTTPGIEIDLDARFDTHAAALEKISSRRTWGEISTLDHLVDFAADTRAAATRQLLGRILVRHDVIDARTLEASLEYQSELQTKLRLGRILTTGHHCTRQDLQKALCLQQNIPLLDLDRLDIQQEALNLVPHNIAVKTGALPVLVSERRLIVAVENPLFFNSGIVSLTTGMEVRTAWADQKSLQRRLDSYDRNAPLA